MLTREELEDLVREERQYHKALQRDNDNLHARIAELIEESDAVFEESSRWKSIVIQVRERCEDTILDRRKIIEEFFKDEEDPLEEGILRGEAEFANSILLLTSSEETDMDVG